MSYVSYSKDEMREIIAKAGFRIVNLESSVKQYTFSDLSTVLSKYDYYICLI